MKATVNKFQGSNFDDFLKENDILEETEALALKKILAYQLEQAMLRDNINKTRMALKMHTSRSALDRLLDPQNTSITLNTLVKAAHVIGKKINITLANKN